MQNVDYDIFFVASMKNISAWIEIIIYVRLFLRAGRHWVLRIFILKWGRVNWIFFLKYRYQSFKSM